MKADLHRFAVFVTACLLVGLLGCATPVKRSSIEEPYPASLHSQPSPSSLDRPVQQLISFSDIVEHRFTPEHSPTVSTHLPSDLIHASFLFSDPPASTFAPIIDLTHPLSSSSLSSLLSRYKHLHIYRRLSDSSSESLILLLRRDPRTGYLLAPGSRIEGLNERIREIEYVKHRYGEDVAWARFHRLFNERSNDEAPGSAGTVHGHAR